MASFVETGCRRIASLQAEVRTYEHWPTGARHVHFATGDAERAFLVAFPTLPMVGDGRAHVLEHLLLCGSKSYPVRDPFFAMTSRSLATFMNAMTYPDRTVYPFATPDRADYFNLMDVYLDATFFPRLDRLDFLQEAWRPVLKGGRLALQGVVLNEMKGRATDPRRTLYLALNRALLPGTTYAIDSGGEPLLIPQLTHTDLLTFHADHYHPSRAVFMSWGDVDAAAVQARLEQRVLECFVRRPPPMVPPHVPMWSGERQITIDVPAANAAAKDHGLQMAWRLGPDADLDGAMRASLLESALLAPGGGLLRQAAETAGLGRVADHVGLDNSTTEIVLHLGISGLAESEIDAARECMLNALGRAAREGVSLELLRAGVRELRWLDRSLTRGVQRLIGLARAAVRGHDLLAAADGDERLCRLQEAAEDPRFVQRAVQSLLADAACVLAHVRPDPQFIARQQAAAECLVQDLEARLTDDEREAIATQTEALALHQRMSQGQAAEVLPRITPADVSREPRPLLSLADPVWQDQAFCLRTNGLSHALLKVDASAATQADWPWLHLYAELLPQLGARDMDHQAAAVWRRLRVAALHARCQVHEVPAGPARLEFTLAVDALREEQGGIAEVMAAWFQAPELADADRLKYLVAAHVQMRVARLTDDAPRLAAIEAQALVSAEGRVERVVRGLPSLDFLGLLRRLLTLPNGTAQIQAALQRIHALLNLAPRTLLCAGIEQDAKPLLQTLQVALGPSPCSATPALHLPSAHVALALAVHAPSRVNHCLALWQVPAIGHCDAPALAVLAELLQHRLLHPLLREQGGAYGAIAEYRPLRGDFACMSRSDPRLAATFTDIQTSLAQLQVRLFTPVELEEAVLGVIKRLDRPLCGLAELEHAWATAAAGAPWEVMAAYRDGVLRCTLDDVRNAAARYLVWSRALRTAAMGWRDQDDGGLEVVDLTRRAADAGLSGAIQHPA